MGGDPATEVAIRYETFLNSSIAFVVIVVWAPGAEGQIPPTNRIDLAWPWAHATNAGRGPVGMQRVGPRRAVRMRTRKAGMAVATVLAIVGSSVAVTLGAEPTERPGTGPSAKTRRLRAPPPRDDRSCLPTSAC